MGLKLRRWCVSQVSEPLMLFWTLRAANRECWDRWPRLKSEPGRFGLYRWDGKKWRKQAYALVDLGRQKAWVDLPEKELAE